ncbi:MAG: hypothetical protein ABL982_16390 [Vicinamibacterales bacterium]
MSVMAPQVAIARAGKLCFAASRLMMPPRDSAYMKIRVEST